MGQRPTLRTPYSYIVGVALTIGSNIYTNIKNKEPFARIMADVTIDVVGSIIAELGSIGLGVASGPLYIVIRPASEMYLSLIWESAVRRYHLRYWVTSTYQYRPKQTFFPEKIPTPTGDNIMSTPEPISKIENGNETDTITSSESPNIYIEPEILPTPKISSTPSPD